MKQKMSENWTHNVVIGVGADARGKENVVIGANSVAIGSNNTVVGANNTVEGNNNIVFGSGKHIKGDGYHEADLPADVDLQSYTNRLLAETMMSIYHPERAKRLVHPPQA